MDTEDFFEATDPLESEYETSDDDYIPGSSDDESDTDDEVSRSPVKRFKERKKTKSQLFYHKLIETT